MYITILSLLATLASAGVKGFGIIFSVAGRGQPGEVVVVVMVDE